MWDTAEAKCVLVTAVCLSVSLSVPRRIRANLQSVHVFRCYDNIHVCKLIALYNANAYSAERKMSASACTRSMPGLCCFPTFTDLAAAMSNRILYFNVHCVSFGDRKERTMARRRRYCRLLAGNACTSWSTASNAGFVSRCFQAAASNRTAREVNVAF